MKRSRHKVLFFVFLLFGVFASNGQEIGVSAAIDTAKLRIGEQANIDLYFSYDASQKKLHVRWPQIGDTLTSSVEVISVSAIDTTIPDKNNPSTLLQHQRITVSVYDSGFFAIPGFKFVVNDDTVHPRYTEPLLLEVHTVPTDTSAAKVKDIKPPFLEPFNWKWYIEEITWTAVILLLIGIAILIWYFRQKNRSSPTEEPDKPKIPAHILALETLERVKADQIWKQGQIKEYYSQISDAIRLYIEQRYELPALESTTDEIMTAFRSQVIDSASKEKLHQILALSDLVKFAKMFPVDYEHELTLQHAFDFVNGTKREDETENSPEPNSELTAPAQ